VRVKQETGCPAQLPVDQWAIESKWGEKPVGHAHHFAIRRAARHTQRCNVTTEDSLDASCQDYAITRG
jgi:hypothetical protein